MMKSCRTCRFFKATKRSDATQQGVCENPNTKVEKTGDDYSCIQYARESINTVYLWKSGTWFDPEEWKEDMYNMQYKRVDYDTTIGELLQWLQYDHLVSEFLEEWL